MEYSPHKDVVFCLPCYLFNKNHGDRNDGRHTFAEMRFRNWKKVNDGKNCAFLCHEGVGLNSMHKRCLKFCDDLLDQSQHIEKVFDKQSAEIIAKNRLRLKTSIDVVRWFTFQACAFRGNDESLQSLNRGNFIELTKLMVSYSSNVANVVLENAPRNAQYISPSIQKKILYIFARRVRAAIGEEIGISIFFSYC